MHSQCFKCNLANSKISHRVLSTQSAFCLATPSSKLRQLSFAAGPSKVLFGPIGFWVTFLMEAHPVWWLSLPEVNWEKNPNPDFISCLLLQWNISVRWTDLSWFYTTPQFVRQCSRPTENARTLINTFVKRHSHKTNSDAIASCGYRLQMDASHNPEVQTNLVGVKFSAIQMEWTDLLGAEYR